MPVVPGLCFVCVGCAFGSSKCMEWERGLSLKRASFLRSAMIFHAPPFAFAKQDRPPQAAKTKTHGHSLPKTHTP